jgi:hypothetical protein
VNFKFQPSTIFLSILIFHKSGLVKSCFEGLSVYNISLSHVKWCKFCIHLNRLKIPLSSKALLTKILTQVKVCQISSYVHDPSFYHSLSVLSTRVHELSPYNVNLNFNCVPCSCFWFFTKVVFLQVVRPLKIYKNTKFHGPTFTGGSFTSFSDVLTSATLKWLKLRY